MSLIRVIRFSLLQPWTFSVFKQVAAQKKTAIAIEYPIDNAVLQPESVRDQDGRVYPDLVMDNIKMLNYYWKQGSWKSPEEFSDFVSAMRRPLPQSIRLNRSLTNESKQMRTLLEDKFWKADHPEVDVRPVDADKNVWVFNKSRWEIKEFKNVHKFIKQARFSGWITRQELVSIVPVKLLKIQSHHKVLDMCSSPGSKTKQALEDLHFNSVGSVPSGFVIANEFNPSRCSKLVANIKTVASPCVVATNHDGRSFPNVYMTKGETKEAVKYDRIICDQPCSGDGTIRKNPNVWLRWTPSTGNQLHELQYDIAKRGLELLKVGGLFAYSSCAMNPVENEAVLYRLLKESKGAFEITDVSRDLLRLGLKASPGLERWKLYNKDIESFSNYEEYSKAENKLKTNFIRQMFGPEKDDRFSVQLRNCMRFLPHENDNGGFFVAMLKKTAKMPWEGRDYVKKFANSFKDFELKMSNTVVKQIYAGRKNLQYLEGEDLSKMEKDLKIYGVDSLNAKLFMSSHGQKVLRMTNSSVKNMLNSTNIYNANVVSAGNILFKVENKVTSPNAYRICSGTGAPFFLPLMNNNARTATLEKHDFLTLLTSQSAVDFCEKLSPTLSAKLQEIASSSGPGTIKLKTHLKDGTVAECLAYLGRERVQVVISESRRHLQEFALRHDCKGEE